MAKFTSKSSSEDEGRKTEAEFTVEGLSARELMVVLDKPFTEETVETDGDRVNVQKEGYEAYEEALGTSESGTGLGEASEGEMEATALDLDDVDIHRPEDLIALLRDMLEDLKADIRTGTNQDGDRTLDVVLDVAGQTFEFTAEDLTDLGSFDVQATGLDADAGGEVIGENDAPRPVRGLVRQFRMTSNGDDDTLRNDNTNTLVQTKAGFIVTSLADVNLNTGINGTLAIFIA